MPTADDFWATQARRDRGPNAPEANVDLRVNVAGDGEKGSTGWWASRLLQQLARQATAVNRWWDYYEGLHPLPWLHEEQLTAQFDRLQRISRTNYCGLVVDAVEERLDVEGFRVADSGQADDQAWTIWQDNDLDELSQIAHVAALVTAHAYGVVWPDPDGGVRVWVEDGLNMTVSVDPRTRRTNAAVKAWHDDLDDLDRVELLLPDGIHRYVRQTSRSGANGGTYEPDSVADRRHEELPDMFRSFAGEAGLVPVERIAARPGRRIGSVRSELDDAVPIQDRINQTTFDRLVAQHYSSFQQIVGIGVEPETDAETGQQINPFRRNPARAWVVPNKDAKVETIDPANLEQMLSAVEQDVTGMARVTKTPPYYLEARGQFPSGDAIRSAEAGLVKKASRRARQIGGSWERILRYAFAAAGDHDKARQPKIETIWADVAIRTEGELVDALVKMKALGVPNEALWERWGASQVEIARWRSSQTTDLLLAGLQPIPTAPDEPAPEAS